MPDFDLNDVVGILTPSTVLAVGICSLALAVYIWRTSYHADSVHLIRGWFIGLAFLAIMAGARFADGSRHWEAWLGTMLLWSEFVWLSALALYGWKRYVVRRRPRYQREHPV